MSESESRSGNCLHLIIKHIRSRKIRVDRMQNPPIRLDICGLKGNVIGNQCDFKGCELDCEKFQQR